MTAKERCPPPPPPPELVVEWSPPPLVPPTEQPASTSGAARASAIRRMGRVIVRVLQALRGNAVPVRCPDRFCLSRAAGQREPLVRPPWAAHSRPADRCGRARGSAAYQRRLEVVA